MGIHPLGLQIYYFIISKNADRIDYLYGEGREGACWKEGCESKTVLLIYIIYSGWVCFIQMRLSCVCMHKKCFFFQIRSIEKPVTFFKNGHKKIVFITKCNEKIVWNALFFRKKLSASPKNGNPPPPPIKNNGPSLICIYLCGVKASLSDHNYFLWIWLIHNILYAPI